MLSEFPQSTTHKQITTYYGSNQPSGWNAPITNQKFAPISYNHITVYKDNILGSYHPRDGITSTTNQSCAHITGNLLPAYRQLDQTIGH